MSKDLLPGGVIRWEDPPEYVPQSTSNGSDRMQWQVMAAQLRSEPGAWAVLKEGPKAGQMQARINGGLVASWQPRGAFKAVVRNVDGVRTLYVKYVGDPAAADLQQPAVADRVAVDAGHDDPGPRVGGVDHLAAAEGDGNMPGVEDEVTALQLGAGDGPAR